MTPAVAAPPEAATTPTGARRPRRHRLLAAVTLVLAAAVSRLSVPAASPAHAVGNCTAADRGGFWKGPYSVGLMRTSHCTCYARLVIDDPGWGI